MKKLAIAQIVLGVLSIGSIVFWTGSISGGYHRYRGTFPDGMIREIMGLQPVDPYVIAFSIIYFILGLSVLICGAIQFFEAWQQTSAKLDKPDNTMAG